MKVESCNGKDLKLISSYAVEVLKKNQPPQQPFKHQQIIQSWTTHNNHHTSSQCIKPIKEKMKI